jgi:hypothetical protein
MCSAIKEAISAISCPICASRVRLFLSDAIGEGKAAWEMLNVQCSMLNCRMTEEIAMKKSRYVVLVVGLLVVAGLSGCSQETPVEKTKAAAASGSAATQAAGQAAVDAIQTPLDKARQTESVLEQSAEQTAAKIKESTQ